MADRVTWHSGRRPITLAILAMGGEGGGVLSDWIVSLAHHAGWTAQNTSVAGVAQRTGATVYYVELYPPDADAPAGVAEGRPEPILSLFPTPGQVDIVIASELMEAGRAIQRGFTTPDRTTLIASTNRVYAVTEKIILGDGRVDSDELLRAAVGASKRLISADFAELARQARSVISAALFGALCGSGALPFPREDFERSIRASGKGVEASLAAFALGFDAALAQPDSPTVAAQSRPQSAPVDITIGRRPQTEEERKEAEERRRNDIAATDPASLVGAALRTQAERVGREFPAAARSMLLHGVVRTAVYQDETYADRYLDRVAAVAAVDADADGAAELTRSAARHVALWMTYQDTIQVALQKVRSARLEHIRTEAGAKPDQILRVHEYLDPPVEEIAGTLPTKLGTRLSESRGFQRLVHRIAGRGLLVTTTSVTGFAMLSFMARLRPWRPKSLRFGKEQARIDTWLASAVECATEQPELAREILECQQVLKGYGATHAHGTESFERLMAAVPALRASDAPGPQLAALRAAALKDEDGHALTAALSARGLTPALG